MIFKYQNFNEAFSFDLDCSYTASSIENIEESRRKLEGLFFERVLKDLGIKRPAKLYPCRTSSDMRKLHEAIIASNAADHVKISVLFYILLDFDAPTGRRVLSTEFEKATNLPHKYSIFMKGLWHMDRLELDMALQYLTHPSLTPTYPDEILEALVRHAQSGDYSLPLAYYYSVQPTLTSTPALESLFTAIARTSVTDAFYFLRTQPEHTQRHMFEVLIAVVHQGSPREAAVQLVNLPLTAEEEEWFEEYLVHGDGHHLRHANDTLKMRMIGTGYLEGSLPIRTNTKAVNGLDWSKLSGAVMKGLGPRLV